MFASYGSLVVTRASVSVANGMDIHCVVYPNDRSVGVSFEDESEFELLLGVEVLEQCVSQLPEALQALRKAIADIDAQNAALRAARSKEVDRRDNVGC